jgi:hypothetical protein
MIRIVAGAGLAAIMLSAGLATLPLVQLQARARRMTGKGVPARQGSGEPRQGPPFDLKFTPGQGIAAASECHRAVGVAICKDMDFTPLSRKYGRADAALMLEPAWDFNVEVRGVDL